MSSDHVHDRRQDRHGRARPDHSQGGRGRGHLHPAALRLQGPRSPTAAAGSARCASTAASRRPACRPSSEGAVVENDTPELSEFRRNIIDLLFVEGNHFCMFCEKSGLCELQALAYRFGITAPQYPLPQPEARHRPLAPGRLPGPQPLHPLRALRPRLPGTRPQERLPVRRARLPEAAAGQRRGARRNRPAGDGRGGRRPARSGP